jgi:WD40 repeat protein
MALPPMKHRARVKRIKFSPDGQLLASASYDHTARVWDAATGQPVTPPLRHDAPVDDMAFSPDGKRLATASQDFTARIWNLHLDEHPLEDLLLWSQLLTGEELEPNGTIRELDSARLAEIWQTLRRKYPAEFAMPVETERP